MSDLFYPTIPQPDGHPLDISMRTAFVPCSQDVLFTDARYPELLGQLFAFSLNRLRTF